MSEKYNREREKEIPDKLIVEKRNVYGRELAYPVCEASKELVKLTGKVTFDEEDLNALRLMGFEIVETIGL